MQYNFIEGYVRFHRFFLIKSQMNKVSRLKSVSDVNFVIHLLYFYFYNVLQGIHSVILPDVDGNVDNSLHLIKFKTSSILL